MVTTLILGSLVAGGLAWVCRLWYVEQRAQKYDFLISTCPPDKLNERVAEWMDGDPWFAKRMEHWRPIEIPTRAEMEEQMERRLVVKAGLSWDRYQEMKAQIAAKGAT